MIHNSNSHKRHKSSFPQIVATLLLLSVPLLTLSKQTQQPITYKLSDKNSNEVKAMFTNSSDINELKVIALHYDQTASAVQEPQLSLNIDNDSSVSQGEDDSNYDDTQRYVEILQFRQTLINCENDFASYLLEAAVTGVALPVCDLECSAHCFTIMKDYPADQVFEECLKPMCNCYTPTVIPNYESHQVTSLNHDSVTTQNHNYQFMPQHLRINQQQQQHHQLDGESLKSQSMTTQQYKWSIENQEGKTIDLLIDNPVHILELKNQSLDATLVIHAAPRIVEYHVQGTKPTTIVKRVRMVKQPQQIILEPSTYGQTSVVQEEPKITTLKLDATFQVLKVVKYNEDTHNQQELEIPQTYEMDGTTLDQEYQDYVEYEGPFGKDQLIYEIEDTQRPEHSNIGIGESTYSRSVLEKQPKPIKKKEVDVSKVLHPSKKTKKDTALFTHTEQTEINERITIEQTKYRVMIPEGYNILKDCRVDCSHNCFSIKAHIPFNVLEQCIQVKCNCLFEAEVMVATNEETVKCNHQCAHNCIDPAKNFKKMHKCIKDCGCSHSFITSGNIPQSFTKEFSEEQFQEKQINQNLVNVINKLVQEGLIKTDSMGQRVLCPCQQIWINKADLITNLTVYQQFIDCYNHINMNLTSIHSDLPLQTMNHQQSKATPTITQTIQQGLEIVSNVTNVPIMQKQMKINQTIQCPGQIPWVPRTVINHRPAIQSQVPQQQLPYAQQPITYPVIQQPLPSVLPLPYQQQLQPVQSLEQPQHQQPPQQQFTGQIIFRDIQGILTQQALSPINISNQTQFSKIVQVTDVNGTIVQNLQPFITISENGTPQLCIINVGNQSTHELSLLQSLNLTLSIKTVPTAQIQQITISNATQSIINNTVITQNYLQQGALQISFQNASQVQQPTTQQQQQQQPFTQVPLQQPQQTSIPQMNQQELLAQLDQTRQAILQSITLTDQQAQIDLLYQQLQQLITQLEATTQNITQTYAPQQLLINQTHHVYGLQGLPQTDQLLMNQSLSQIANITDLQAVIVINLTHPLNANYTIQQLGQTPLRNKITDVNQTQNLEQLSYTLLKAANLETFLNNALAQPQQHPFVIPQTQQVIGQTPQISMGTGNVIIISRPLEIEDIIAVDDLNETLSDEENDELEDVEPLPHIVYQHYQFVKRTNIKDEQVSSEIQTFEKMFFTDNDLDRMQDLLNQIGMLNQILQIHLNRTEIDNAIYHKAKKFQKKVNKAMKKQKKRKMNIDSNCDFECMDDCLNENHETSNMTYIYSQCSLRCQCSLIQSDRHRNSYDKYDKSKIHVSSDYQYLDDCNLECGMQCSDFCKGSVAWQVVDMCYRTRCNCHYDHETAKQPEQDPNSQVFILLDQTQTLETESIGHTCNRACAYEKCLRSDAGLSVNGQQCLAECGCTVKLSPNMSTQNVFVEHNNNHPSMNKNENTAQNGQCRIEYCSFFNKFKEDQIIEEERVKQLIKSKAILTLFEIEEQKNTFDQEPSNCNVSCVEDCFDKYSNLQIHEVQTFCIEPRCKCGKTTPLDQYQAFLQIQDQSLTDHILLNQVQQNEKEEKITEQSKQLNSRAVFNIDFTVKDDTCCLDFSWHLLTVNSQPQNDNNTKSPNQNSLALVSVNHTENIYDKCDLDCQKNCYEIQDRVPFSVFKKCISSRCGCDFTKHALTEIYCDKKCKENCTSSLQPYTATETVQCIANCGCNLKQDQSIALFIQSGELSIDNSSKSYSYWITLIVALSLCLWVGYEVLNMLFGISPHKGRRQSIYTKTIYEEDNDLSCYHKLE